MKAILALIDELDRLDSHPDPEALLRGAASVIHRAGDLIARTGHSALYLKSLDFGEFAETTEVRAYLADCLAASKQPDAPPETLDAKGVASFFNCTVRTVWRWEARALIPEGKRIGNSVRWDRAELERFKASK